VSGAISVFSRIGCVVTWPAMILSLKRRRPDIIGLYLKPADNAAVFCVDERALSKRSTDLTGFALSPWQSERHGLNIFRHGTLSLYAALTLAPARHGKTTLAYQRRVCRLSGSDRRQPADGQEIHIVADNLSAHKTKSVLIPPGQSNGTDPLHPDLF